MHLWLGTGKRENSSSYIIKIQLQLNNNYGVPTYIASLH